VHAPVLSAPQSLVGGLIVAVLGFWILAGTPAPRPFHPDQPADLPACQLERTCGSQNAALGVAQIIPLLFCCTPFQVLRFLSLSASWVSFGSRRAARRPSIRSDVGSG